MVSTLTNNLVVPERGRPETAEARPPERKIRAMNETGQLFGWSFGDRSRAHEPGYLDSLRQAALANAKQDAASRGFEVEAGTETYAVIEQGETLVEVDSAPGGLIVRCTVTLVGPGAGEIHAEGPMNG